jgi:hypothetical protein
MIAIKTMDKTSAFTAASKGFSQPTSLSWYAQRFFLGQSEKGKRYSLIGCPIPEQRSIIVFDDIHMSLDG